MSMGSIHIYLHLVSHPYPEDPGAAHDIWGSIRIQAMQNSVLVTLLDWQWDLLAFAEWFVVTQEDLLTETFYIAGHAPRTGESLSQALERMRERDDFVDEREADDWFDALYIYYTHHSLQVALRGAAIPDIIVGLNRGQGEISLHNAWHYSFDIESFCTRLRREFSWVFREQMRGLLPAPVKNRVQAVLSKVELIE